MTAQIWDINLGPLIESWWATMERICAVQAVEGLTNAQLQTLATGILAERIAQSPANYYGNTFVIAAAQGLAANTFS